MEVVSPQQILGQQIANSQIAAKKLGPQFANLQIATHVEGPQM